MAAGLIAYLWLGEKLEGLQILVGFGVLLAAILIQKERERDLLAPAMIKKKRLIHWHPIVFPLPLY